MTRTPIRGARRRLSLVALRPLILYTLLAGVATTAQPPGGEAQRQLVQPDEPAARKTSGRRTALVIGNSAYHSVGRLDNPVHDARDIAATLQALGFEVVKKEDQTVEQMKLLIKEFGERLRREGGVGLFFYAGHGVQVGGRNYLVPVEVERLREKSIEFEAVDVGRVLAEMETAGNDLNIVILDACRSNPFTRGWRPVEGGLAQMSGPTGTLIAYATAPGAVASDGNGSNGLYTAELLRQMRRPGVPIEQVFKEVRREVKRLSGGVQVPWESSMLVGDFYFSVATQGQTSSQGTDLSASAREHPRQSEAASSATLSPRPPALFDSAAGKGAEVPKENRERSDALTRSGDAHRMKGEYDAAIADLNEAAILNPDNYMAYTLRGETYRLMGKTDFALIDLTLAIRINPTFAWPYHLRALALLTAREYGRALADLNTVIRLEPKNYGAYHTRGAVYRAMGQEGLAAADEQRQMSDLSEAIRLHPRDASKFVERCNAYRMKLQLDEALRDCSEALRLDPKNVMALSARGNIYQMKVNYDLALKDLNEAIGYDPKYWWAYERRAEVYRSLGLKELAAADERKAQELKSVK